MHSKFHGSICAPEQCAINKIPINSKCPNGQIFKSTMEGDLEVPMLSDIAKQALISHKLNHLLVSIGALCYSGFIVIFKIKHVIVVYKDKIILREWRNHQNNLLYFLLSVKIEDYQVDEDKNHLVNNIYGRRNQDELKNNYIQLVSDRSNRV